MTSLVFVQRASARVSYHSWLILDLRGNAQRAQCASVIGLALPMTQTGMGEMSTLDISAGNSARMMASYTAPDSICSLYL